MAAAMGMITVTATATTTAIDTGTPGRRPPFDRPGTGHARTSIHRAGVPP